MSHPEVLPTPRACALRLARSSSTASPSRRTVTLSSPSTVRVSRAPRISFAQSPHASSRAKWQISRSFAVSSGETWRCGLRHDPRRGPAEAALGFPVGGTGSNRGRVFREIAGQETLGLAFKNYGYHVLQPHELPDP